MNARGDRLARVPTTSSPDDTAFRRTPVPDQARDNALWLNDLNSDVMQPEHALTRFVLALMLQ